MCRNREDRPRKGDAQPIVEDIENVLKCRKAKGHKHRIHHPVVGIVEVDVVPGALLEEVKLAPFFSQTYKQHLYDEQRHLILNVESRNNQAVLNPFQNHRHQRRINTAQRQSP